MSDNPLAHPLDPYALTTGNLRRCATCVYLACEASVADDIAKKLRWAADEIESLREQLAKQTGSALSSTNSCSAATKHSGTFLGYRDEHGNEMHCAHAFCPHQAKCRKGCINPVAVTSTNSGKAASRETPADDLGKLQAGAPSPVDGKR